MVGVLYDWRTRFVDIDRRAVRTGSAASFASHIADGRKLNSDIEQSHRPAGRAWFVL